MARTQDDFLAAVGKFIDELVDHELLMRDVQPQNGPVHNKRRQLSRILYDEYMQDIPPAITPQNLSNDLVLCGNFVSRCQVDLIHVDQNVREKALCTLRHLQYKISRLRCTAQADMDSCQRLLILLRMIINNQNPPGMFTSTPNAHTPSASSSQSNAQQSQGAQTNNHANSGTASTATCNNNAQRSLIDEFDAMQLASANNNRSNAIQNTTRTNTFRPKVYKWNIKFSNEKNTLGVFEFIQKVEAKAKAYDVTHELLFQSACELFDGFAATWFMSQTFRNWNDIKEKLISDFMQVDYFENLLDTIRQRKQAHNEAIVHFFTVFEDDCSRLPVQLTVDEKLNILKKNILQKYRPYVALNKFNSVDEMKHALKVLEMSMSNNNTDNNKYVRFNSGDRNGHSNEYRRGDNSNFRSRYDKFQSKSQNDRNRNDRSSSNTSQRSGDENTSRSNFDRKSRPPTPNFRYNSNERKSDGNSSEHRSGSRNRSQSHEKN